MATVILENSPEIQNEFEQIRKYDMVSLVLCDKTRIKKSGGKEKSINELYVRDLAITGKFNG